MPAYLLHEHATVRCLDRGDATPSVTDGHVTVSGHNIVTQPTVYNISGCQRPASSGGPCVSAQWITAARRVTASGRPVLFKDSRAVCAPTGSAVKIGSTQTRVKVT